MEVIHTTFQKFCKDKFFDVSPIAKSSCSRIDALNSSNKFTEPKLLINDDDYKDLEDSNNNFISTWKTFTPVKNGFSMPNDINEEENVVSPESNFDCNASGNSSNVNTPESKDAPSPPYKRIKALAFQSSTPCNGRVTPPYTDISFIKSSVLQSPRPTYAPRRPSNKSRLNLTAPINPFTPDGRSIIHRNRIRMKHGRTLDILNTSTADCVNNDEHFISGSSFQELERSRFIEEFKIDEFLASGSFGVVYKCTRYLDGAVYAVKKSAKPVAGTNYENFSRREIFAHAALRPRIHLLTYYSSWIEMGHLYIQTEYCNGGSLEQQIRKGRLFSEVGLRKLTNHVAKGLKYIHIENLAHLDIKSANILISKVNRAESSDEEFTESCDMDDDGPVIYKVADLGNVTVVDDPYDVEDGDCRYMPNELLNDNYSNLKKADIFSFGMTLYEAAGGGPLPKNGEHWHDLRNGKVPYLSRYSLHLNSLIKHMLHPDPEKRPDIRDVLQSTYIKRRNSRLTRPDCYSQTIYAASQYLETFSFSSSPSDNINCQTSSVIPDIVVDSSCA